MGLALRAAVVILGLSAASAAEGAVRVASTAPPAGDVVVLVALAGIAWSLRFL